MNNIKKNIKERRSVRNFDGRSLDENTKAQLMDYAKSIQNPFGIPVEFKYLEAKRDGLNCPVVSGTDLYVGAKIQNTANANVAFGYTFEEFILYAQSLGLGTVWLGGTMNRDAYEKAMALEEGEMMPCATPVGYVANKMSVREIMMRKAIKADERKPFEEVFFEGNFNQPLTKEKAGEFAEPLEMVRLAPSAVNKQPWRVVVVGKDAHFYLQRRKGSTNASHEGKLDIQKVDLGIALCHFALTAKENGLDVNFVQEEPGIKMDFEGEYIGTYQRK